MCVNSAEFKTNKNHFNLMTVFLCATGFCYHCILAIMFSGKNGRHGLPFFDVTSISLVNEYKGKKRWLMISEQNKISMTYLLGIFTWFIFENELKNSVRTKNKKYKERKGKEEQEYYNLKNIKKDVIQFLFIIKS